jgi:hypothetical protein
MDCEVSFNNQPTTGLNVEWGFGLPGASSPYLPTDGVFFRLNSAGLQGIVSTGGTETSSGVFPATAGTGTWVYSANTKYQYIVYLTHKFAEFWVGDGVNTWLLGSVLVATAGQLAQSTALPVFFRHAFTTTPSITVVSSFARYSVRLGGPATADTLGTQGNRMFGSYEGLGGGTMGSLATYVNSTNPTAAAPANTSLTANLPGGLGGQGAVIAAVAAATDGIWLSYQNQTGLTTALPNKRIRINGLRLDAVNIGAAVATTATTLQFALAFGHTAVSLATAESAAAKAPRRIPLGFMTWAVAAPVGAQPQFAPIVLQLQNPIYINPGEFVALVGKFLVGTATASQVIEFTLNFDYGWE